MKNIVHVFFSAAEKYPDTVAIIHKGEEISYKELAQRVKSMMAYLQDKGIDENDKVLVFIPMSIDLYAHVLAIFGIGATAVFVDEWASVKRIKQCCERVPIDAFVASPMILRLSYFVGVLRKTKKRVPTKKEYIGSAEVKSYEADRSALITFTTGSTSIPKAADRTHEFLFEQYSILKPKLDLSPGDVCMVTLPIVLLCNLGLGITSLIADVNLRKPEKMKSSSVLEELSRYKAKLLICSPFIAEKLASEYKGEALELNKIITGGAPVFPQMAEKIKAGFQNTRLEIVYGSTEAEPISTISSEELLEKKEAIRDLGLPVGKVHPKTEIKIIEIKDGPIESLDGRILEDGNLGEIIVAGNHVLKRYFNSPQAYLENKIIETEKVWHRTGDSGILKNGELYLNGRCRQIFSFEDALYAPFILEYRLLLLEEIRMGTFLRFGDKSIAAIELNDGKKLPKDAIEQILPASEIRVLKRIPRDPRHNSKIDYDRLREIL